MASLGILRCRAVSVCDLSASGVRLVGGHACPSARPVLTLASQGPAAAFSCRSLAGSGKLQIAACRYASSEATSDALTPKPKDEVKTSSEAKEVDNSIEGILARSRRKELIERVGPQAERYLPTEDPNAFLLPDSRLEPAERTWQKVFVALPWAVFACMLAAPLLLVRGNLPFIQKRAEEERQAAARRASAAAVTERVPEFQIVNFGQMPDVLERPFPTVLVLFHPGTFASKVYLPALHDLECVLRRTGIPVSLAAMDMTASPAPPDSFLWEYPAAMSPHIQLIVPRATDGEAGVIDYDGRWTASAIAAASRSLAGPGAPELQLEDLQALDVGIERLRDLLFELYFVEDGVADKQQANAERASWWRFRRKDATPAAERSVLRYKALQKIEEQIDCRNGLDAAIASCQHALSEFRGQAK
eukprot:TRINITY_DN82593_c0_g1_i1.p1 TRINITY_DN82593_c0_g1~~TRINITY_DN82593_c0_g1_i1.p1  ORF type:complete len:418 (+),score=89.74 TRINITY_DN82593_c0_g1_i1:30-1283(+)